MLTTQQRIVLLICSTQLLVTTAFVVLPNQRGATLASSSSSSSSLYSAEPINPQHDGERRRRLAEFLNLEPLPKSDLRKERLEREEQNKADFATYGNDLWELRSNIDNLSDQLVDAISTGKDTIERKVRNTLHKEEQRDPELVYKMELEAMHDADEAEVIEDEIYHKDKALNARSCLPHFNLEGLWVGK